MTRREFARNTIGALFGVSTIPAAFEKPTSITDALFRRESAKLNKAIAARPFEWRYICDPWYMREFAESSRDAFPVPPPDISEATKIHLKEMWG